MIKYKNNCKVCQTIKSHKKGKKLAERIYFSSYFNPSGEETLKDIQAHHPKDFSYESLLNHVKKHQFISEQARDDHIVNKIQEKSEHRLSTEVARHQDVRKLIMDKGYKGIEEGKIKINAANVINAAKHEADWESKQADRQLALMEMVYHYASGEATKSHAYDRRILTGQEESDDDPAELVEGTADTVEDGPDSVHDGVIGPPPPPRPARVPETDDQSPDEA